MLVGFLGKGRLDWRLKKTGQHFPLLTSGATNGRFVLVAGKALGEGQHAFLAGRSYCLSVTKDIFLVGTLNNIPL